MSEIPQSERKDLTEIRRAYEVLGKRYGVEYNAINDYEAQLTFFASLLKTRNMSRLLDIGCGPGFESSFFMKEGLNVTSVDVAMAMLRDASRRGNVTKPVQADILRLPFPDQSFDGVWAGRVNIHIPPDKLHCVFEEASRVLVPRQGFFALVNFAPVDREIWDKWWEEREESIQAQKRGEFKEQEVLPPLTPPYLRLEEPEPLAEPSEQILYIRWHYDPSFLEELAFNNGFIRWIGVGQTDSDGDISTTLMLKYIGKEAVREKYGSYEEYRTELWKHAMWG